MLNVIKLRRLNAIAAEEQCVQCVEKRLYYNLKKLGLGEFNEKRYKKNEVKKND